nr:penicillin-binding protein 2 [Tomitella biformata]
MMSMVMAGLCVIVIGQLVWVQGIQAPKLTAESASQRTMTAVETPNRGQILDSAGQPLAYTLTAKALTFQPVEVRRKLTAQQEISPTSPDPDTYIADAAAKIHELLGDAAPEKKLLEQMNGTAQFVYLARQVDPAKAAEITSEFSLVGADPDNVREYPGGALAANIVGAVKPNGEAALGLESSMDALLAGTAGSKTYDQGSAGDEIPGSLRDVHPAVDGSNVQLTLDSDLQYFLQQAVQSAKDKSGAENVSALVLDAKSSHVLAMSNDNTLDPSLGLGDPANAKAELGNLSVSTPFEPGSVNKIITAAAAIEDGLTTPDEVLQVPGSITMDNATVADAWVHGVAPYTTTGVFGKSSNVGTLMLAQRVGPERFSDMLTKFGLGQRTDVGLPGESAGMVPALDQWSGGTFANLPIGQGLSMTLLQMAGLFQTIANDGTRIPPRIVQGIIGPDGEVQAPDEPEPVQVVSPETARTVRDMFRAVVQDDTGNQRGTGVEAAVEGYQVSGKTGTAQQVDPACGCYSNSDYWITFAGMAPTDDPRYVIAIMLDKPQRSSDGTGGQSAAPLFHDIAAWLLQRDRVPMSPPAPQLVLQAD